MKKRHFVIIIFMLILILTASFYCTHKKTYIKVIKEGTTYRFGRIDVVCERCNARVKEKYGIPNFKKNNIYITGTDIKEKIVVTSFAQNAVDNYNIVYTEETKLGINDPFILGHDYKGLGNLHQTKVGEYIILNINGRVEKTLHIYTCYGEDKNGRWLVLAKQIY